MVSKLYPFRGCPLVHQPPPRLTARHYPNLAPDWDLPVIGPPVSPAIIVKGRVARIRLAWVHRLEPLTIRFLSRHQAPIRRFYDDRNADVDDRRLVRNPATVNVWLTGEPDDRLPLRVLRAARAQYGEGTRRLLPSTERLASRLCLRSSSPKNGFRLV